MERRVVGREGVGRRIPPEVGVDVGPRPDPLEVRVQGAGGGQQAVPFVPQAHRPGDRRCTAGRIHDEARIHRFDATKLKLAPANRPKPFTHVFMDPPYNRKLWSPVLRRLPQYLAENAVVMLEESVEAEINPKGWTILSDKEWGKSRVLFLRWNETL